MSSTKVQKVWVESLSFDVVLILELKGHLDFGLYHNLIKHVFHQIWWIQLWKICPTIPRADGK